MTVENVFQYFGETSAWHINCTGNVITRVRCGDRTIGKTAISPYGFIKLDCLVHKFVFFTTGWRVAETMGTRAVGDEFLPQSSVSFHKQYLPAKADIIKNVYWILESDCVLPFRPQFP